VSTLVELQDQGANGIWARLANGVCRRAFSSPEAFAYEATIAPALAKVVVPVIRPMVVGHRVLDVGCGGGLIATSIAGSCGVDVFGVDPSISQVRRLSHRSPKRGATFAVRSRAESLPFPVDTFDTLISSCAWKHWPDPKAAVAECVRVVRPGGKIVIVEIDGSSTAADFWRFARGSRVPVGLRRAYVRFAMRTVVGVAPDPLALANSFADVDVVPFDVDKIEEMPFLVAEIVVI
jgi:SAM-dependent methyltransferase